MKKIILSTLMLLVSGLAMANSVQTQDGRMNVMISNQSAMVIIPGAAALNCTYIKTQKDPVSLSGGEGIFYHCGEGLDMSFKHYDGGTRPDSVFIWDGDKIIYHGFLISRVK